MPPKVISGGDNPYDIHDAKLSSSATAHESSSVTAHEISNILTFATIQSAVRRDPVVVVENLNGLVCDPHINFALYILMWNGV